MNKMEREENLIAAFTFFDKDGSGFITIDELQQACHEYGLSDVHLDEIMKEIDLDNVSIIILLIFKIYHNPLFLNSNKKIRNQLKLCEFGYIRFRLKFSEFKYIRILKTFPKILNYFTHIFILKDSEKYLHIGYFCDCRMVRLITMSLLLWWEKEIVDR